MNKTIASLVALALLTAANVSDTDKGINKNNLIHQSFRATIFINTPAVDG